MIETSDKVPENFCDNFALEIGAEEIPTRIDFEIMDKDNNDKNYDSIRTETFLQPRKTFKEILEILTSRTEMKQIFLKYKCLVFSSLLALVGLIISLRMVILVFILHKKGF